MNDPQPLPPPEPEPTEPTSYVGLALRYLRQPSTQHGVNILLGLLAVQFGMEPLTAIELFGLVTGLILALSDDRVRAKTVAAEVVRTVEAGPVQASVTIDNQTPIDASVELSHTPPKEPSP